MTFKHLLQPKMFFDSFVLKKFFKTKKTYQNKKYSLFSEYLSFIGLGASVSDRPKN